MLVAPDSVPQGFERRVDNVAAAVIVHVGNYRLIQPRQSVGAFHALLQRSWQDVMSTPSPAARRFSGILEYGLFWLLVLCTSASSAEGGAKRAQLPTIAST